MAENSVPNLIEVIKSQTDFLEQLSENLFKLEGLLFVGMQTDLTECSDKAVEGYLWTIRDLIIHSSEINQSVLHDLISATIV